MVKKLDLAPLGAGPVAHPIPRLLRDAAVAALSLGLATSVVGDQLFMAALARIVIGRCGGAAGYLTVLQAATVRATDLLSAGWSHRTRHTRRLIVADRAHSLILNDAVLK